MLCDQSVNNAFENAYTYKNPMDWTQITILDENMLNNVNVYEYENDGGGGGVVILQIQNLF